METNLEIVLMSFCNNILTFDSSDSFQVEALSVTWKYLARDYHYV